MNVRVCMTVCFCIHGTLSKREGSVQLTVDLLVLIGLDQLLWVLQILFTFLAKQATLMRRSTVNCTEPSPAVSVP